MDLQANNIISDTKHHVDYAFQDVAEKPKAVTFNNNTIENEPANKSSKEHKENVDINRNTVRFSERTVMIPVQTDKNKGERRKVLRQRNCLSQDNKSENTTGTDEQTLTKDEPETININKQHHVLSYAKAKFENPDQELLPARKPFLQAPMNAGPDTDERVKTTNSLEYTSDESENEYYPSEIDAKNRILSISDTDEYDTDLEIDENFGKVASDLSDLNIGTDTYLKFCRKWKIAPQRTFVNSLPSRTVSLRNRSLGSNAIAPVCIALKDNLRVERINLEGTDMKAAGSVHVAEMLLDNINITHVNLSNNDLRLGGAQMIGHVMAVTKYLTHLNLSGNKFDDNCAWFLSTGITTNTTLESLDLSNNSLEDKSGKIIGKALVINERLKVLNLGWNKLCGKGSVAIFHALMFNKTLEILNISWNGIGYEGSVALSKCLKKNRQLRDIDVSNNRIDWKGAPLIAIGLKKNSSLTKFSIGYNPLTTSGVMELLEAASSEGSALSLLDASEISVVGEADLLAATISRKRKFTFLHGRIVPTHDKLGQRPGREPNPMLRVIEYLRLLGLRPLELLKSFDKSASFELPRAEFVQQIKRVGVKLHPFEIEALANSISAKGYDRNVINYRKLAVAVREVVQEERERKIKEREEWKQIRNYHEKILRRGTLDHISLRRSSSHDPGEKDSIRVSMLLTPNDSHSSLRSQRASKGPLSLCAPLNSTGSKPKNKIKKRARLKKKKKP